MLVLKCDGKHVPFAHAAIARVTFWQVQQVDKIMEMPNSVGKIKYLLRRAVKKKKKAQKM